MPAYRPTNLRSAYISFAAFIVLGLLALGLFVLQPTLTWLGFVCLGVADLNLAGSIYTFVAYRRR